MLEVCRKEAPNQKTPKFEPREYIVTKYEERETNENGRKIIERVPKKTNITKQINDTAKIVKQNLALEKLEELKQLYTNK